jgi:hypothetical protein
VTKQHSKEVKEQMIARYKNGESAAQIAESLNLYTTSVTRVLKRNGVTVKRCAGENHHMWKGGRVQKGDGYIGIWIPEHERADHQGYVYEHTLVIEKHLGRLPGEGEVIHHINGDKQDNRLDNLHLCNTKEHKAAHWSLEKHLKNFIDNKIVVFIDGKYELAEGFYEIAKRLGVENR